jgi:hypothetical protein
MKITGFSFIKDVINYDYIIIETLKSILPILDWILNIKTTK